MVGRRRISIPRPMGGGSGTPCRRRPVRRSSFGQNASFNSETGIPDDQSKNWTVMQGQKENYEKLMKLKQESHKDQCETFRSEIENLEKQITSLQADLTESQEDLETQTEIVAEMESTSDLYNTRIGKLTAELEALKSAILQKDREKLAMTQAHLDSMNS